MSNRSVSPIALEMFQSAAKTFAISALDEDGNPIDLSGRTLRFVVHDANDPPVGEFEVEDADITVSGDDNEVANVAVDATKATAANANFHWQLWDVTTENEETVLANGSLRVRSALKDIT